MSDKKISQLTPATTPLDGTEVLPIVQSGSTVKVAVSDLTAGRAISASDITDTALTASKPVFTDANKKLTSAGTLGTDQGGTGLTSFTTNGVPYATSSSAITTNSMLNFSGTRLQIAGTTSSVNAYDAAGTAGDYTPFHSGTPSLSSGSHALWLGSYANIYYGVKIKSIYNYGVSNTAAMSFETCNGSSLVEAMRIDASQNVSVTAGNLVIGTSGKGIDFSATASGSGTMTSELLADYEEGDFAPVITAESGSLTYTSSGKYVKIGRQVTLNFTATITNIGTATGYTFISVPFTNGSQNATGNGFEPAANAHSFTLYLASSSTTATIYRYDGAALKGTNYVYIGTIVYQI